MNEKDKYRKAKKIVQQISDTKPLGYEFALVDRYGQWTLSDYVCPAPAGKLLFSLDLDMESSYASTAIYMISKHLV